MARKPIGGLMDKNVPSQLDPEDLAAEVELEVPGSMDNVVSFEGMAEGMDIEISPEEDGGVTIDFDPEDQRGMNDDFYANLAEEMPDRELDRIAGELLVSLTQTRQEGRIGKMLMQTVLNCLGSTTRRGPSRLEGLLGLRTRCLPRRLRSFRRRRSMSCCQPAAPCELLLWEARQEKSSSSRNA